MVLSPSKLVILHSMVTPMELMSAFDSKSSEEDGSRDSILMKRVSSMTLLMIEVRGSPREPSDLLTLLMTRMLIFPLSVKS